MEIEKYNAEIFIENRIIETENWAENQKNLNIRVVNQYNFCEMYIILRVK